MNSKTSWEGFGLRRSRSAGVCPDTRSMSIAELWRRASAGDGTRFVIVRQSLAVRRIECGDVAEQLPCFFPVNYQVIVFDLNAIHVLHDQSIATQGLG